MKSEMARKRRHAVQEFLCRRADLGNQLKWRRDVIRILDDKSLFHSLTGSPRFRGQNVWWPVLNSYVQVNELPVTDSIQATHMREPSAWRRSWEGWSVPRIQAVRVFSRGGLTPLPAAFFDVSPNVNPFSVSEPRERSNPTANRIEAGENVVQAAVGFCSNPCSSRSPGSSFSPTRLRRMRSWTSRALTICSLWFPRLIVLQGRLRRILCRQRSPSKHHAGLNKCDRT